VIQEVSVTPDGGVIYILRVISLAKQVVEFSVNAATVTD
jgi:hypothetical protein